MLHKSKVLFLLGFAVCIALAGTVQAEPSWDRLSTTVFANILREQGLPHPIVMAVTQDADGFIWAGTQGGLARYDGYGFRTFLHKDNDPGSLPGDVLADLATDSRGRLWVGTLTGDIARFDAKSEKFLTIPPAGGRTGRSGVFRLVADDAGGLWAATNDGLDHIDGDTGAVQHFAHVPGDPDSLPNDRVRTIALTRDGTLWVATFDGLVRLPRGERTFHPVPLSDAQGRAFHDVITTLFEDGEGSLWFGTTLYGIGRVRPTGGQWGPAAILPELAAERLGKRSNYLLAEGRPGQIWIGRISEGLIVFDVGTGKTRVIRHDATNPLSLSDDTVRSMFRDRSGLMWVATNRGLSRTNLADSAIDSIMPSALTKDGLPGADVVAVSAAPGNRAWLGMRDQGMAELDPEAGTIRSLADIADMPSGLVNSFTRDDRGGVWFPAADGQVICRLDLKTGHILKRPFPRENTGRIMSGSWHNGSLWLPAGPLVRYDPATDGFKIYHHDADPTSLADDSAISVLPATEGGLWVATRNGLDHLDVASGIFHHVSHDEANPRSLPANFVSSLLIDRQGRLWVGTLGGGIGVMTLFPMNRDWPVQGPEFRRLTKMDGLPTNNIGGILEDDTGRIWASTSDGLAVIDPESFKIRTLGFGDGLAIPAYWVMSAARMADGTLLFGGGGGLTVVHPERLGEWTYRPPVVISAVHVNGRVAEVGPTGGGPLILDPAERKLEVEFAALDYSAPDRLRYAYKLEGFDEDWIGADSGRRLASYTNLPPGHYRLLIKGSNRAGAWSEPIALEIRMTAAWWQTVWFRLAVVGALFFVMWVLVQVRTAFLRRRRQLLEDLVARQTEDLRAANRRLEELASRDGLTGIFNRRYFLEHAEREIERARRSGRPVALLMIDVDHFKKVNDTWGHIAGDEVLRSVVNHIKSLLRDTDLFARLGGEELVVVMPETEPAAAMIVAERLRAVVAESRHLIGEGVVPVTISIGLAVHWDADETLKKLIDRADRALYLAKGQGRNRVVDAFEPDRSAT